MSGEETREKLLTTAERLFAEQGIDAVSLRQINTEAGQRNASATHYHFGSKQALIEAILERRMATINDRRLAMVAALGPDPSNLRPVVECVVRPLVQELEEAEGGSYYIRFLAQAYADPTVRIREVIRGRNDDGLQRAIALAHRILCDVPPELLLQRITLAAGQMIYSLADRERTSLAGAAEAIVLDTPFFVDNLVDIMVGTLSAPISDDTRAHFP